jgi:hypothetical protein
MGGDVDETRLPRYRAAGVGHRGAKRLATTLGTGLVLAGCALLLAPSTAFACPVKKVGRHRHGCSFRTHLAGGTGCPQAKGQQVKDWTDFNTPRKATDVKGSATVSPPCQNATQTVTVNVAAKTDPDGTRTHPPPGDKVVQVVVTETGTGPSSFNNPTVIYDADWANAKPLYVEKGLSGKFVGKHKRFGHVIQEFDVHDPVRYVIIITNPNAEDVVANLTDHLPRDFKLTAEPTGFRTGPGGRPNGPPPGPIVCSYVGHELRCRGLLIKGRRGKFFIEVVGRFTETGEVINRADATGATVDDAPLPKSNEGESIDEIVEHKH